MHILPSLGAAFLAKLAAAFLPLLGFSGEGSVTTASATLAVEITVNTDI